MTKLVAQFNGGMVDGSELARKLAEYPNATVQINDGWIDIYSDDLPRSHPVNILSDLIQQAWDRGAISDTQFNRACDSIGHLYEKARGE